MRQKQKLKKESESDVTVEVREACPWSPYIDGRLKERRIATREVNDHDHPCSKGRDPMARKIVDQVDIMQAACATIAW